MFRNRPIGSFTLGVSFVVFGVFFLINAVSDIISYTLIFTLWPFVLILLGIEVLVSYAFNKSEPSKYSGVSIFLLVLLTVFALGAGAVGYAIENSDALITAFRGF